MSGWDVFVLLAAGLGSVGGLLGILAKFRLQRDHDRFERDMEEFRQRGTAAIEQIRTSGTKEVFVHKMQFESEFSLYLELSEMLVELRKSFNSLVALRIGDLEDPDKARTGLTKIYEQLRAVIYPRRPFYDVDVYNAADEILLTVAKEVEIGASAAKKRGDRLFLTNKGAEKLAKLMEVVFARIRERVWSQDFRGQGVSGETH